MKNLNWPANRIALYIHIPFCKKKCDYCSFVSFPGREDDIPSYVEALKTELKMSLTGKEIYSIYFGGGTPSLLSAGQVAEILGCARSVAGICKDAEISLEANPGTVDREYLAALLATGINRLSLGVQSFDDADLAVLGRIHKSGEARQAITWARQAGFKNINIDLIYGLPGQKQSTWQRTVREAMDIQTEHISMYALTLEEGTPLYALIESGKSRSPDPDIAADCYESGDELLSGHGYHNYEISNWAKAGYECRHNMVYWQSLPYIGIGLAAHSYPGSRRTANTPSLEKYIESLGRKEFPIDMAEDIDNKTRQSEYIMLSLRLSSGLDMSEFKSRFGIDFEGKNNKTLEEMNKYGFLEKSGDNIMLTRRGRLMANEIIMRLLP